MTDRDANLLDLLAHVGRLERKLRAAEDLLREWRDHGTTARAGLVSDTRAFLAPPTPAPLIDSEDAATISYLRSIGFAGTDLEVANAGKRITTEEWREFKASGRPLYHSPEQPDPLTPDDEKRHK